MYPVAIGGLGGSGTRLVAQILMDVGIFLGDDLNSANDNLTFTFFFKRPDEFKFSQTWVQKNIRVFEKYMCGKSFSISDWQVFLKAYFKRDIYPANFHSQRRNKILFHTNSFHEKWGWKEPNTHIFLEPLAKHFPDMSYIHVVRHGLDMAFSGNLQQLNNWGDLYDINLPVDPASEPQMQLEYWVNANQSAIEKGKKFFGNRFYLCNYDALCMDPIPEIKNMLTFLNIRVDENKLNQLTKLPAVSSTMGRFKERDLNIFPEEHLQFVRSLGFTV